MEQKREVIYFILTFFLIFFAFIAGMILFFRKFRKSRITFTSEKQAMESKHREEILTAQLDSQQQTMQHIGTEIHDNVGQKLTLASLYTKQLSTRPADDMERKVAAVGSIIDESLMELRQLSKTLTNPGLANAGLESLLQEEAKRINVSGICHVAVNFHGSDIVLPQADKSILFRLLQEFMQNSLKHSGCRKISISVDRKGPELLITATDDGRGFITDSGSAGIGLQNMKRRAEQLNAVYQLNSEAGKGTILTLQLPLTK